MNIKDYAIIASQVWDNFAKEDSKRQNIQRYFHLRPTNSGITIVSTLSGYEMRGITKIKNYSVLLERLKGIHKNYSVLTCIDDVKRDNAMDELSFPRRNKKKDIKLEEKIQAIMINTMSKDRNLKEMLGAASLIRFVASEFIFEKGKHRVDIVGYDGQDIYLFELKKGRTTAVNQVEEYIKYYSKKDTNNTLRDILKVYPINPVQSFERLIGVMVMEHAESSYGLEKWQTLAKQNDIRILFYKPSLMYENIA